MRIRNWIFKPTSVGRIFEEKVAKYVPNMVTLKPTAFASVYTDTDV